MPEQTADRVDGISEKFSEKPKRGRPGIKDIDPQAWAVARRAIPDEAKTDRSVANQVYIHNALSVLGLGVRSVDGQVNRAVYGWLIGVEGDDPDWFKRIRLRRVIL